MPCLTMPSRTEPRLTRPGHTRPRFPNPQPTLLCYSMPRQASPGHTSPRLASPNQAMPGRRHATSRFTVALLAEPFKFSLNVRQSAFVVFDPSTDLPSPFGDLGES
jgi:hypothetical protein